MSDPTLRQMVVWQREDFKAFEIKHDRIHVQLDKKIDRLNGFMWKAVGGTTLFLGLVGLFVKVIF